jgi:hypothetical protein
MKENQLKEIYVEELKDLYSAENQLVKALPKMAKAATSDDLRAGFEEHLEQTKGHVQRLEDIFKTLGENPKGKTCKGMQGLITEGSEMIDEEEGEGLDVGLISAAQRGRLRRSSGRRRGRFSASHDTARRKRDRPEADGTCSGNQCGSGWRDLGRR